MWILSLPACIFVCIRPLLPAPPKGFASSMNQDLVASDGRATEIGYLNGEVVAAGRRTGVPTPLAAKVLEVIEQMEKGSRPRGVLSPEEASAIFFG